MDEHAFPPTGFLWLGSAHVTFGGSGGMVTTAGAELPYPGIVPRPRLGTSLLGGGSNVTG